MKKILTMLLSLLMVATLGIVNVSADTFEYYGYTWCNDDSACYYGLNNTWYYTKGTYKAQSITIGRALSSANLSFDGREQTLFSIECKNGSGCNFYYSLATIENDVISYKDWKQFNKAQGESVNINATDVGKYYLFLKENEGSSAVAVYTNTNNSYGERTVTISKASADNISATINNPNPTGLDASSNPYYVIGEGAGTITLPFTADVSTSITTDTSFSSNTTKTWSIDNSVDSKISIDNDGNLTINSGLSEGVYTVKLTLKVENNNYEDKTVDKTIKIIKTSSYDIKFKDGEGLDKTTNGGNDLIYGRNQDQIIKNIDSIYTKEINGVSYKVYPSVIDGDTPTTVISLEQNYGDDTYISEKSGSDYQKIDKGTSKLNISPNSNSTDHYKITIKVTHKYGTSDSYSYKANDTFDIVRKAASATVSKVEGLVYDGTDQVLATATDIKPDGSDGASIEYKVVKEVDKLTGDLNATTYAGLKDINDTTDTYSSVTVPKAKDAGTYYVYYHLKHGSVDNYKDAYGYLTVTIAKRPLTIEGFEDKTIDYDGKNHKTDLISNPLFKVTGCVEGEESSAYTISYGAEEYINAGTYTTTITATSNYCLSDTDQTETTVSKTLTINTLEAKIITNKSTSTYYKGHDKTAVIVKIDFNICFLNKILLYKMILIIKL